MLPLRQISWSRRRPKFKGKRRAVGFRTKSLHAVVPQDQAGPDFVAFGPRRSSPMKLGPAMAQIAALREAAILLRTIKLFRRGMNQRDS
jgi:hypothetical protein